MSRRPVSPGCRTPKAQATTRSLMAAPSAHQQGPTGQGAFRWADSLVKITGQGPVAHRGIGDGRARPVASGVTPPSVRPYAGRLPGNVGVDQAAATPPPMTRVRCLDAEGNDRGFWSPYGPDRKSMNGAGVPQPRKGKNGDIYMTPDCRPFPVKQGPPKCVCCGGDLRKVWVAPAMRQGDGNPLPSPNVRAGGERYCPKCDGGK